MPPEGVARYHSWQPKTKQGAAVLRNMLQDSTCGFLSGCCEDIFKENSMQKLEVSESICKRMGGREAVHSPSTVLLTGPTSCFHLALRENEK